jgi:hypothetical protein
MVAGGGSNTLLGYETSTLMLVHACLVCVVWVVVLPNQGHSITRWLCVVVWVGCGCCLRTG